MSKKRGFAAMDPEEQRALASKGGKAAHAMGRAHEFTSEEAQRLGAKGARVMLAKHGPEHMARIGRIGGTNAAAKKAAKKAAAE